MPDLSLNHPRYRLIRQDRKRGAGGILVYILDDLPINRKRKLETENVESICLEVNSRFLVCACYRSAGKCKENDFISSLTNVVEMMYRTRNELLLIGDFKINMMESNKVDQPNKKLADFCDKFCLRNQITQPTIET